MLNNNQSNINEVWLKASVLGCLWASSEIVIGSFLHNIKVPFSGIILTFIGIVLMTSVSKIWPIKGLIWRSGLICALMKAISPSAIIIGPMIAILAQALLMNISIYTFKKTLLGSLIGGMLAMSWNLFQLLASYIIIYGTKMIELYVKLSHLTEKIIGYHNNNYWAPILTLLFIYMIIGMLAAIIGYIIGNNIIKSPVTIKRLNVKQVEKIKTPFNKTNNYFKHSISWLIINFILLILILTLITYTNTLYWMIIGTLIIATWALRYKNSLKKLTKPSFWLAFIIITMLSALLFSQMGNTLQKNITLGLIAGLQMNFRAIIMIIGFSAISTELGNKKIRNFFIQKSSSKQLAMSLEVAFDTLPQIIANLPKLTEIFKKPLTILHQLVAQADFWLEQINLKYIAKNNFIILIEGSKGEGKTSLINDIIYELQNKNTKIGGILAPAIYNNKHKHCGYDIIDLKSKNRKELAKEKPFKENTPFVGNYYFNETAIAFGKEVLLPENLQDVDIIIIDEVGPWELENQGWAKNINLIIKQSNLPMIWAVRRGITQKIIDKRSLEKTIIFDVTKTDKYQVISTVLRFLNKI
ncbi:MAG TPA: nucleoside-triphosphatase [Bacteroidales bacterium]|nr:nucleoside-triphosphatase [Bacteroidales bacterium]